MKFILQLTGLVLTVSTLYVWIRTPVRSFDAIDLSAKEESPLGLAGRPHGASSLNTNAYAGAIRISEDTEWQSSKKRSTSTKAKSPTLSDGSALKQSRMNSSTRRLNLGLKSQTLMAGYIGTSQTLTPTNSLSSSLAGSSEKSKKTYRTISTYSDYYIGRKMSNGVPYNPAKLTVASNDWKLGTRLRITYNGKSVTATLTDRMAKRFSGIRVDASTAVWKALGGGKPGLLKGATVEVWN